MKQQEIVKSAIGGTVQSVGYTLKLAKWGLSTAEVVFNGAANLANGFVKAPDLGLGKALFGNAKQFVGNLSERLIKAGKNLVR